MAEPIPLVPLVDAAAAERAETERAIRIAIATTEAEEKSRADARLQNPKQITGKELDGMFKLVGQVEKIGHVLFEHNVELLFNQFQIHLT